MNKPIKELYDIITPSLEVIEDNEGRVEVTFMYSEKKYKAVRDYISPITGLREGSKLLELNKEGNWIPSVITVTGKGGKYPQYRLGKSKFTVDCHRLIAMLLLDDDSRNKLFCGDNYVVNHMVIRKAELDYKIKVDRRNERVKSARAKMVDVAHTVIENGTIDWVKNDDVSDEDYKKIVLTAFHLPYVPCDVDLQLPMIDVRIYEVIKPAQNREHSDFIRAHKELLDEKISAYDIPLFKELLKRNVQHILFKYKTFGRKGLEDMLLR